MRKNMSLLFREIKVDLFKILLRRVHVVLSHLIILRCNDILPTRGKTACTIC